MCRRWSWHGNSWSSTTTRSKKIAPRPELLFARAGRYLLTPGTVEHRYVGGTEPLDGHSLQQGEDGGDELFSFFFFHAKASFRENLCIMRGLHWEPGGCKIDGTGTMVILKHMFSAIKRTFTARPSVPREDRARRMVGAFTLPREQHSTAKAGRERPRGARRAPDGRKRGRRRKLHHGARNHGRNGAAG